MFNEALTASGGMGDTQIIIFNSKMLSVVCQLDLNKAGEKNQSAS